MYTGAAFVEIEREKQQRLRTGDGMSLIEREATRMATAINDYDFLSVVGVGGDESTGYKVTLLDERFDLQYEIGSHFEYWDFLAYFLMHVQYPSRPIGRTAA